MHLSVQVCALVFALVFALVCVDVVAQVLVGRCLKVWIRFEGKNMRG